MGTLGDGLRKMRELALQGHPLLSERATFSEKLFDDMIYEAHNFVVFRAWHLRGRELYSLHRMRCLCAMLRRSTLAG
jgi:hypothetical protein